MRYIDIQKTPGADEMIDKICRQLNVAPAKVLSGWPYNSISMFSVTDILAVYHELGLHQVVADDDPERRWYVAAQIVARIYRDRRSS